jgi:hypothetical protein
MYAALIIFLSILGIYAIGFWWATKDERKRNKEKMKKNYEKD